jgi:hypothetical protein
MGTRRWLRGIEVAEMLVKSIAKIGDLIVRFSISP